MNSTIAVQHVDQFASWFHRQDAATRLDIMSMMIQMLHPLELRFFCNCVEFLKQKDYVSFYESEIHYNTENIGPEFLDLTNPQCRSKLLVALSLLHYDNYAMAGILFRILLSLAAVIDRLPRTNETFDELLLLLNMAKNHPAFKFEQKTAIADFKNRLLLLKTEFGLDRSVLPVMYLPAASPLRENADPSVTSQSRESLPLPQDQSAADVQNIAGNDPPASGSREIANKKVQVSIRKWQTSARCQTDSTSTALVDASSQTEDVLNSTLVASNELAVVDPTNSNQASVPNVIQTESSESAKGEEDQSLRVEGIAVIDAKNGDDGTVRYQIKINWPNGEELIVEKSHNEFHKLHQQILSSLPFDAGVNSPLRRMPYFSVVSRDESRLQDIELYIKQILLLTKGTDIIANFLSSNTSVDVPLDNTSGPMITGSLDLNSTMPSDLSVASVDRRVNKTSFNGGGVDSDLSKHSCGNSGEDEGMAERELSNGDANTKVPSPSSELEPESKKRLPFSRFNDRSSVSSTSLGGNGVSKNLATALVIVGQNPGSASVGRIAQSNGMLHENGQKYIHPPITVNNLLSTTNSNALKAIRVHPTTNTGNGEYYVPPET